MGACPEKDDLYEYALTGIEESQRQHVLDHLNNCPPCREQIKEFAAVNEGLALAAPEVDCPETMAGGVMDRIRAEAGSPQMSPEPFKLTNWAMFWMRLGPVFAVLSIVMTLMTVLAFQSLGTGGRTTATELSMDPIAELMASPGVQTVALNATGIGKSCSGSITCAKGNRKMMISVDKLKKCPLGRVYAVWCKSSDGTLQKIGTFQPHDKSAQSFVFDLQREFDPSAGMNVEVTLESDPEGIKPAGEVHLAGIIKL